ncbi:C2 family cysteine protease [Amycolatopsis pigmentata]|uniref:C2 family cysteine protease n=1 Tax=Amycolatopsis pigmentata TaxID=450801 RepID=A0ABW5G4H3_9PSEU
MNRLYTGAALVAAAALAVGGVAAGHLSGRSNADRAATVDLAVSVPGDGGGSAAVANAVQQTRKMIESPFLLHSASVLTTDLEALDPAGMDSYLATLSNSELRSLDRVLRPQFSGPAAPRQIADQARRRLVNALLDRASGRNVTRITPLLTFLQPELRTSDGAWQKNTKWDFQYTPAIGRPGGLYGPADGPDLHDADQRDLNDCYFHAELLSLARRDPIWVEHNITQNDNGTYTVTFYPGGTATKIDITANLPYFSYTDKNGIQQSGWTYGGIQSGIWIALYEKAYAQLKGGYPAIEGNDPLSPQAWTGAAYTDLTGNASERAGKFTASTSVVSAPSLDTIARWLTAGKAVVTSSNPYTNGLLIFPDAPNPFVDGFIDVPAQPVGDNGAAQGASQTNVVDSRHEYVVESVDTKNRTITLANPWGSKSGTPWQFRITEGVYHKSFMDAAAVQLPSVPGDYPPPNVA